MTSESVRRGLAIVCTLIVATVLTAVAPFFLPACSDLGGVENPFYCMGGLGGFSYKPLIVTVILWLSLYGLWARYEAT